MAPRAARGGPGPPRGADGALLQVYKLVLAARLADAGLYERALAYAEAAARAVTLQPARYSPRLVAQLAELADRSVDARALASPPPGGR